LFVLDKLYQPKLRNVIVSTAAYVFAFMVILPQMSFIVEQASQLTITPDSDLFYNFDRLMYIRRLYNKAGIEAYVMTRFTYDLLWPIIYTFFTVSTLGYFGQYMERTKVLSLVYALPIGAVVFDVFENSFCSIFFMEMGPHFLGYLAVLFSGLKWLMVFGMMVAQCVLLILYVIKKIKTSIA